MIVPLHTLPKPANQNHSEAIVMLKGPSLEDKLMDILFGFADYDAFLMLHESSDMDRRMIAREYAQIILNLVDEE